MVTREAKARRKPLIEEVEPRVLYSSDLSPLPPPPIIVENRSVDPIGEFSSQPAAQAPTAVTADARHEIVFVESDTPHYTQLIDDIKSRSSDQRKIEVVLLDSRADGISQISSALAGQSEIAA